VLPLWSAAVDPRVLAVRALKPADGHARLFDPQPAAVRMVRGPRSEHLVIYCGGEVIRLDVIDGTMAAGPVSLRFDLADDDRLSVQISTIRTFRTTDAKDCRHRRLASRLLALQAVDARDVGASLQEIAQNLLGPGAWPGDGEHRKSLVRRLVVTGEGMIRAGPRAVLAGR